MKTDETRIVKFNEFFDSDRDISKNVNIEDYPPDAVDYKYTGLPMIIYTYAIGLKGLTPVLKVQNNYSTKQMYNNCFTVSISNDPKIIDGDSDKITHSDLTKLFKWVVRNKIILINLWHYDIDNQDFFDNLKKA
jgi:hypothetical protein